MCGGDQNAIEDYMQSMEIKKPEPLSRNAPNVYASPANPVVAAQQMHKRPHREVNFFLVSALMSKE